MIKFDLAVMIIAYFNKKVTQTSKKLPIVLKMVALKFWLKDGAIWSDLSKAAFKLLHILSF